MTIRKAEQKDARAIGACHYHCWQETYRGLISNHYLDSQSEEASMERFERMFGTSGQYLYVLEEENAVIGFFDIAEPREGFASYEVRGFYLRKAHQGRGYGRVMMDFIKAQTAGEPFYLWCLKTNPTTGFYARMGGKPIAEKEVNIGGRVETEVCFLFD